jgi:hypothetical protein
MSDWEITNFDRVEMFYTICVADYNALWISRDNLFTATKDAMTFSILNLTIFFSLFFLLSETHSFEGRMFKTV